MTNGMTRRVVNNMIKSAKSETELRERFIACTEAETKSIRIPPDDVAYYSYMPPPKPYDYAAKLRSRYRLHLRARRRRTLSEYDGERGE